MNDDGSQRSDDTLVTCFFDEAEALRAGREPPRPRVDLPGVSRGAVASVALRIGSRRIALLCGDGFVVGRQRSCSIVPPSPPQGDETARRRSLKVSRRHCVVFFGDAGWCVRDGEGDRRSSFGTWWLGQQVEGVAFIGSQRGLLSLGGPSAVDSVAFDVGSLGASLVLLSRPDAAVVHVLLRGETPLDALDASLAGLWVRFADGGIRWLRGGESGTLVPGTHVPGASGDLWVE